MKQLWSFTGWPKRWLRRSRKSSKESPAETAPGPSRNRWGREFPLVEGGLDESSVVSFVDDLIQRYRDLSREHEETKRSRDYSRYTVEQAHSEAERLVAEARREVEREASRIISEAKREANELVASSTRRAEALTEQQTRGALENARMKADLIESQAKRAAQLFFVKVHEDMQASVSSEVQEGYYRLLDNLQDLLAEAQKLESQWRSRTAQLWDIEIPELERYKAGFLDTLAKAIPSDDTGVKLTGASGVKTEPSEIGADFPTPAPSTNSPLSTGRGRKRRTSRSEVKASGPEEAVFSDDEARNDEKIAPSDKASGEETAGPPKAMTEGGPAMGRAPQPFQTTVEEERGSVPDELEETDEWNSLLEEKTVGEVWELPAVEETRERVEFDLAELLGPSNGAGVAGVAPQSGEGVDLREDTDTGRDGPSDEEPDVQAGPGAADPPADRDEPLQEPVTRSALDHRRLFEGEVDLVVPPPVNLEKVSGLYRELQEKRELKVLRTSGSWSEGTTVTILLERPVPLLQLLDGIPTVMASAGVKGKGTGPEKITITFDDSK